MINNLRLVPAWRVIVAVLVWSLYQESSAQAFQPRRIEMELDRNEDSFQVESLGQNGLILYREQQETSFKSDQPYEFVLYDTALQEQWRKVYRIERKYQLVGWDFHQDSLYFLYSHYDPKEDFQLVKMGLKSGDTTMLSVRKVVPVQLTTFECVGQSLIFGGYLNSRATVLLYNRYDGKVRVLPNLYSEQSELMEISIDDATNTFDVSVLSRVPREPFSLSLRTYDDKGIQVQELAMVLPQELNIQHGRSANPESGEKIVAGTYSSRRSDYTHGIFMGSVSPSGSVNYSLYPYENLPNFFNYMKAERRDRVMKRLERRKMLGRRTRVSYRLLVHELIEKEDHIIVLGEAFYPVYRYYGGGGLGSTADGSRYANSTYFDGYRYTHAVVMAITPLGEVLWHNSFEIEGLQSMILREFVKVDVNRDRIVLLYLYDGEIRAKVIRGSTMEEGKFFDPISVNFGAEIVQNNDNELSQLDYWYEGCFYAAGIQEIRSLNSLGFGRNRRVFYVNKVVYP